MHRLPIAVLVTCAAVGLACNAEEKINPKTLNKLGKFGAVVVTGSAQLIRAALKEQAESASAEDLGRDVESLTARYRTNVLGATFGADLVRANGEVVITATQVMAASTGVGLVPSLLAGSAARYANDKFADMIASEGKDRALGVWSSGLQTMKSADIKKFDSLVKEQRYSEAVKLFDLRTGKLSKVMTSLKDDPDAAAVAQKYLIETIQAEGSKALIEAGKARAAAGAVEKTLTEHIAASSAFTKQLKGRVDDLATTSVALSNQISDLTGDLEALRKDQQATSYQISIIQGILYEQQPPKTKLAMLEANAVPGLTQEQVTVAKKVLAVEIKKQEVLAVASKVVSTAADVSAILGALGFKDQSLNDAVRYGSVANTALSQAFAGNYLGAAASISGLFGGGTQDPTRAQFERVFQELAQIRQQLNTVIELQKKTLQAIEQLSRQLAEVETRLHERLDRIEFELARVDSTTRATLWQDYEPCASVWSNKDNPAWQYDEMTGFQSVVGLTAMLRDRPTEVFACATKLRGVFGTLVKGAIDNPLKLEHVSSKISGVPAPGDRTYSASDLQIFLQQVHWPSSELAQALFELRQTQKGWGSSAGLFALLTAPAATGSELSQRVRRLDDSADGKRLLACAADNTWLTERLKMLLCTDGFHFDAGKHGANEGEAEERARNFLRTALIRDQVREISQWTSIVASASDFAGGTQAQPMTLEQLADYGYTAEGQPGRQALLGALMLTDIAVAQHAVVYGDMTAYFIYETLWDKNARRFILPASANEKKAELLLKNRNNPWLQRNVAMLILMNHERRCANNPCPASDLVYKLGTDALLDASVLADGTVKLAPVTPDSEQRVKEWMLATFDLDPQTGFSAIDRDANGVEKPRTLVMRSGGFEIAMPLVADWPKRRMSYPPEMASRLQERDLLARRWADYVSLQALDVNQQVRLSNVMSKGGPQ